MPIVTMNIEYAANIVQSSDLKSALLTYLAANRRATAKVHRTMKAYAVPKMAGAKWLSIELIVALRSYVM